MEATEGGKEGIGRGYTYADCEIMLLRAIEDDLGFAFSRIGLEGWRRCRTITGHSITARQGQKQIFQTTAYNEDSSNNDSFHD